MGTAVILVPQKQSDQHGQILAPYHPDGGAGGEQVLRPFSVCLRNLQLAAQQLKPGSLAGHQSAAAFILTGGPASSQYLQAEPGADPLCEHLVQGEQHVGGSAGRGVSPSTCSQRWPG